jgi:hypothetical protein
MMMLAGLGFRWRAAWLALLLIVIPYAFLALLCAFQLSRRAREMRLMPIISFIFPVIHLTWGSSFLLGLLRSPRPTG